MPRTLVDFLMEKTKKEEKYFRNYLDYCKIIKKEVEIILEDAKVFIFGSILKKNEIPQDIDILIISEEFTDYQKKSETLLILQKKLGSSSPFEFHFATPEEYNNWWKHFLKEKLEI
jgi:predicted nucleotidyltransferase